MSSIAAYGPGLAHRESDPLAPEGVPDPYVDHKPSAERALFRMHGASGFPVVTFRPPYVHGPRQPFDREQFFWDRLRDGRAIVLPDGGDAPTKDGTPDAAPDAAAVTEVVLGHDLVLRGPNLGSCAAAGRWRAAGSA